MLGHIKMMRTMMMMIRKEKCPRSTPQNSGWNFVFVVAYIGAGAQSTLGGKTFCQKICMKN